MTDLTNQSPIDLLLTRRSVKPHELSAPGPGAEDLDTILRAAIRVPDHGKLAPWRVQIFDKAAQVAFGDALGRIYAADNPGKPESAIEIERQRPQRAPCLLAVSAKLDPLHKIPMMEQQLSGGAFCQNLLNAAYALGYAGQWLTEWPAYHASVKAELGLSADTPIIGFIYLGTASALPADRPRPEPSAVAQPWTPAASNRAA